MTSRSGDQFFKNSIFSRDQWPGLITKSNGQAGHDETGHKSLKTLLAEYLLKILIISRIERLNIAEYFLKISIISRIERLNI